MMDPVVSSKYGKRPLLDMPALHVESDSRMEISSLQPRLKPGFGAMPSMIYRPDGFQSQPLTAPAALPGIPGNLYPAQPPALQMYQQPAAFQPPSMLPPQMMAAPSMQPPQMMGGPAMQPQQIMGGPAIQPPQMMAAPSMQPPQMMAAPSMQPQPVYPAMQPPYQGQGYYGGGGAMMAAPYPQAVPAPRTPVPANFHVEGVLQYGQLTTLHFRDRTSNFQGIPDYLRHELMQTYGKYPVTNVRIVSMNGQYHIYATPRKGEDGDDFVSEYGGAPNTPDARMIGFNEVRGEPRDLLPARNNARFRSV